MNSEEASLLNKIKEILPHRKGKEPPAMVFHGVEGDNFQTPDSPSWFNPQEASQIFFYVNELYRLGASVEDIGIISPYSKQVIALPTVFIPIIKIYFNRSSKYEQF